MYFFTIYLFLLSFPTRRSSDLGGGDGGNGFTRSNGATEDSATSVTKDTNRRAFDAGPALQAATRGADRKSTRLNSSHLVISYAVFCLKNKNLLIYIHFRLHIIN